MWGVVTCMSVVTSVGPGEPQHGVWSHVHVWVWSQVRGTAVCGVVTCMGVATSVGPGSHSMGCGHMGVGSHSVGCGHKLILCVQ